MRTGYTKEEWERFKVAQRGLTQWAISRGILKRQRCAICNGKHAYAHHPDYFRPFDVAWMCRQCHADEHKKLRQEDRKKLREDITVKTLREMRAAAIITKNDEELELIDRRLNALLT